MSMSTATLQVRVARKQEAARDIQLFEFVALDGSALPPFSAGAHIDVEVAPGLTRQYSLCNHPQERHRYQIAVLRDPASRGGSVAMHDRIEPGGVVRISEPRNHFPLAHGPRQSLLFAGGIGVTPILCMAERLAAIDADFEMHYCARSVDRMAFRQRIADSSYAAQVHFHLDDGSDDQKLQLPKVLASARPDAHLYVCGPTGFLDFVRQGAKAAGWSDERVHFEYFSAQPVSAEGNTAFDVRLASSGRTVHVAADCSIAQALADAGVELPVSCEQGVCGTCLTRVLEGEPDHRDSYLTDAEKAGNDQMLPCCSRARTSVLVLDI